ncbi:MAG: preprotein translocase subunit SecA [Candidatus Colwellbacteria bacterium]|nr:preprotein translocase subunit SecA [Candidatus Colwellbacteria bacterium]
MALFSFGTKQSFPSEIAKINELEEKISKLSDTELREESLKIKRETEDGENLNDLLPQAFALVRETAKRTLHQRHFDVQLWGGVVLHQGAIAEMATGEGKTLAATAPAYLNALSGHGVHIITVNDYLAKRDTVWMGQIYHFLGLKTACLVHDGALIYDPSHLAPKDDETRDTTGGFLVQEDFLRPITRREAYEADITYGTNHEFGFDYLRDNMVYHPRDQVQREPHYAIIDEVDSILIDEARTPLIISTPDAGSSDYYKLFAGAVRRLASKEDYVVDEKLRAVEITDSGIDKIEKITGIKDIFSVENLRLVHYLESSLKARALFALDKDYVVRDGEIVIVDQFTGRLMFGRRYSAGLHQAIEAKEGVAVKEESRTFAQITIQNYFRLYKKLAGMTGTAQTSAEEFHKVYNLEVVSIPTNKPMIRESMPDVIYKNLKAKYEAVAKEVKRRQEAGQPVLVGTVSIEKNELISKAFHAAGVRHEVLNAKNHEREGMIIAQTGKSGAVTVATNMAGRGVDIILGGNPPDPKGAEEIKELGGLHVIGTERHEARRIDNQLRGRSGRQGDPGSSQFFLSLEDDLLRIFGGDRLRGLMERFDVPEDMPIENKMVTKAIGQAQNKVEGFNFDVRKHLLEYDDVLNKQRLAFYAKRQGILRAVQPVLEGEVRKIKDSEKIREVLREAVIGHLDKIGEANIDVEERKRLLKETGIETDDEANVGSAKEWAESRLVSFDESFLEAVGRQLLVILDFLWMNNLEDIEALVESVRIRAYGQRDPLVEYRRESRILFNRMDENFEEWIFNNLFRIEAVPQEQIRQVAVAAGDPKFKNVGRNDPCPCGAINPETGKPYKYKKCGLINAPHHKG